MKRVLEDPYYYLANFETALAWVRTRSADLLDAAESGFMSEFPTLPRASRALLVRMIMRKGTLFRSDKLRYAEIGCPLAAAAALAERGWVDANPLLGLEQLFGLYGKAELAQMFGKPAATAGRKAQMLAALLPGRERPQALSAWHPQAAGPVYELRIMPLCERVRLMFFGNLRQDWTEFVLADLGMYRYEKVDFAPSARAFPRRNDVDDYLFLHHCGERLEAAEQAGGQADTLLLEIPPRPYANEWVERRRVRLLEHLGRELERSGQLPAALRAYRRGGPGACRVRAIRMLERLGRTRTALRWLEAIARDGRADEAELQALRRIGPRLRRRLGLPAAPVPKAAAIPLLRLRLPPAPGSVEEAARARLERDGGTVYYVENTLINALFGLLCWDALYAALPGAFFHPFQSGPADLRSPAFHKRRQALFDACLAHLDSDAYKRVIRRNFHAKTGLQSQFVAWQALDETLLELALECIPAAHLRRWFERLLADPAANRAGLPDLIQFWPDTGGYRLVEVKGPGDRVQDNQRRWLDDCITHGMPVAVCHVQWEAAAP
ncbi:VRR-NUC domain-containing protein [Candidimonas nitroreducens]|uniref:phosphodiesterase I n=1 Tax=Candidimonas nitroreducens TaxID=683354 RepID=A0A225MYP9_9BURK|nr:VRR-NUC domain-containing protein [Candidimonas nitroreducens]OWT66244.1 nuclease [Candidimonas nitroreducens]